MNRRLILPVITCLVLAVSPHGTTAGATAGDRETYAGTIRVYVAEIAGRWFHDDGLRFHNAFLAFALEEEFVLSESDSLTWYAEWDGHDYFDAEGSPYDDIQEDNVKVFAAVFDGDGYPGYSDPPSNLEFTVHEIDACAGATPGKTGCNVAVGQFTHSVLVEDGGTTW